MAASDELRPHPAAEIFPLMTGAHFDALVVDIKQNGQREPIIIYNNMILDGRHRYKACLQLGIEPATTVWDANGTAEAFVISKNLHRRHLNESQRAMIAKKLAKLKLGDNQHGRGSANLQTLSHAEAAKALHVSERAVHHAGVVQSKAAPELVQAVERGDISVSTAAQLAHLPQVRQREIAAKGKKTAVKVAKQIHIRKQARQSVAERRESTPVVLDPGFQAEAETAAREIEIERDERIALSGAGEIAAANESLTKQIAMLDCRIAALQRENVSLKFRVKMWKDRAFEAGWKGRQDA